MIVGLKKHVGIKDHEPGFHPTNCTRKIGCKMEKLLILLLFCIIGMVFHILYLRKEYGDYIAYLEVRETERGPREKPK